MARQSRPSARFDLVSAAIAALALAAAVLVFGGPLTAQTGKEDPAGKVTDFPTNPWGGSTGFISLPSTRALASRPRWDLDRDTAPGMDGASLSLAIVGLPADLDHAMLQDLRADTYCLARQSASEQSLALCSRRSNAYTLFRSGTEYNLCGFTDDCWHSTAVAVIASAKPMDGRLYSFETMAAVTYEQGTKVERETEPPQSDDDKSGQPNFIPNPPRVYSAAELTEELVSGYADPQFKMTREHRGELALRRTYGKLPAGAFPMVSIYPNDDRNKGCCGAQTLINRNIVLHAGVRAGGPIYAVNVFSRVDDDQICASTGRKAPCVLTNLVAQEKALETLLAKAREEAQGGGRPRIGAILIVAGGPLADRACDNTPTARHIKALRQLGVYTFVPAGNDGKPNQVRFPGCASDAVTVGALDRDGRISAVSNGRATTMVKLYTDGDTLVLPIRAQPVPGLACMPDASLTEIVEGYQRILAKLGHYAGARTGALDARMEQAVLRFQAAAAGLPRTGKLDAATLRALEKHGDALKKADDSFSFRAVSANVATAGFADLSAYREHLCRDGKREPYYHAKIVSGTLVSAAVAAGQFLKLVDEHKSASTAEVYDAIAAAAARGRTKELDYRAARERLSAKRQ